MKTPQERAELVAQALRMVWGSLDSHLDWSYEGNPDQTGGNNDFHKECVVDYIKLMEVIVKLY